MQFHCRAIGQAKGFGNSFVQFGDQVVDRVFGNTDTTHHEVIFVFPANIAGHIDVK